MTEANAPTRRTDTYGLLFPMGRIVATKAALHTRAESGDDYFVFLRRHVRGDWGDLDAEDKEANDRAVEEGLRILSAYELGNGDYLWIITEADRSVTTLLLPSCY